MSIVVLYETCNSEIYELLLVVWPAIAPLEFVATEFVVLMKTQKEIYKSRLKLLQTISLGIRSSNNPLEISIKNQYVIFYSEAQDYNKHYKPNLVHYNTGHAKSSVTTEYFNYD